MAIDEFVPQESSESDLPEYSYESTKITFDAEEYEYVRKYTTLDDPSDINNLAVDRIYVTDQIYSPVGIFTDLTVNQDLYLYRFLYDKDEFKGTPGQVLLSDASGVRWGNVSSVLPPLQAIDILDEGSYVATVSRIDFRDGSDPNNLVNAVSSASTDTSIVYVSDRWSLSGSNIYRNSRVGINNSNPSYDLDVTGTANITSTLNVDGATVLQTTLNVKGATDLDTTLNVDGATTLNSTLDVDGATTLNSTTSSISKDTGALVITNGGLGVEENVNIGGRLRVTGITTLSGFVLVDNNMIITGFTTGTISTSIYSQRSGISSYSDISGISTFSQRSGISSYSDISGISTFINTVETTNDINYYVPFVQNFTSTTGETLRVDSGIKYNPSKNFITLDGPLSVGGTSLFKQSIELDSSLIDVNGSTATGKRDYRLASVGTGVSWRPPGVETQNAIWVTMDGNDSNSGYLEGDAKRTIGAAAAIAQDGDTIFVRSGVYYENNPIGLRTDVSVSGQDLRLVTIVPNNPTKDVFHVRRGCLIENVNFAGQNITTNHPGCGAVAFPPTSLSDYAISGYIAPGPANEGPSGRWRSPYIRNCTNFMSGSIGMKINGDHATASTIGNDLKCMVCDSFTQYNEAGIGVSITNNGYAQLVSIFTINCDIGIYCDTGGSCDLTNSNSSFGNFGLVAVGLGRTEFTGKVLVDTPGESDIVGLSSVFDSSNNPRRPYDGQSLWFKINLDNYPDAQGSGVIAQPLQRLDSITVTNGGSGYSSSAPPSVLIVDISNPNSITQSPKGPQGIIAEASPTIDDATGSIIGIDVINSGRNYLSTQNIAVVIGGNATATANMSPIYYTVSVATQPSPTGVTTVTFNEFIPYELFEGDDIEIRRISRILTSSHSFEYIGTGTDINTSTPFNGGVPIKANEVVARDGAQIPFTSTDQKGNFDIGEGIQIDQTTNTIRGRDFSRAIQAEVTPLILALR